ncbi:MAG: hypothetical protein CVU74_01125 [Deltaproteobacteria bacterium HGW-Deltaproteobacteria-9]|jgi:hypothetical protein|nr:MAG: hypothetical protein CVU74_01125 [Deltaproteobacteria bacterium HGW-Deltaproteobacteria-9]
MPDLKVYLELITKSDKFQSGLKAGERSLEGFKQYASRAASVVANLTQNIGFLGNAAAALSGGLVLKKLFGLSDYMPIDDALLRMQVNLKLTGKELDDLKTKIAAVAGERGIEQGTAFQSAYKLSFNYKPDEILEIVKISDEAADAMKAPYDVVQDRIVQIMKLYKLTAKEAKGVADAMVASRVDVESLDTMMQRLVLRGGSKKDYIQTLGMLRGLNMAGMSNPRVIMQLNETLGAIQDKADILEASGIKVKDKKTGEWRDQLEVLKDLEAYLQKMRKTMSSSKYDEVIDKTFGPNSRQRLDFIFSQKENFKKGMDEMGHAAQIAAERSAAADAAWFKQLERVKSELGSIKTDLKFIYDLAKKPVKFAADHPGVTKAAGYGAAALSLGVLGALGFGTIKKVLGGFGKTAIGVAEGKALQEVAGVTPVFVTNMPAGGVGVPGVLDKVGLVALAPVIGTVGAVIAATVASATAVTSLVNALRGGSGDNWINKTLTGGKQLEVFEGAWGDMLYDFLHKAEKPAKTEVKNTINLKLDKDLKLFADGSNGADFKINIFRGNFFAV